MKRYIPLVLIPVFSYGLTMDEAVRKAVEANLSVKQQRVELERSEIKLKKDYNLYMPELFMDFSFTSLKDTPYTNIPFSLFPFPGSVISFKQSNKDFKNFEVGINYYIFTGFARPEKIKISKLDIEANKYQYNEKLNDVVALTKKSYIDVLMAEAVVDVYEKQLQAVEKHLERVKEFYRQGLVAKIEVLQTKVKLSEVKRSLRKAKGELKVAKAKLQTILDDNLEDELDVEPVKMDIPEKPDLPSLYKKALEHRGLIKLLKTREKQLTHLEKVKLSPYFPKIAAQLKYFYTDQYPYLDPKGNYALSVGVIWKFQGGKPYYGYLETKKQIAKLRLKQKELENGIKLEVKAAYERFLTAKANLNVAESSLAEAEEYYRMVVEQFKNQLASTTDVLDAESMLTSARKGREISYYQLLKAYVDLEKAVGGSLKDEK